MTTFNNKRIYDDDDISVGRTKMTAARVVGDKLAFIGQVRRGLAWTASLYSTRRCTGILSMMCLLMMLTGGAEEPRRRVSVEHG